MSGSTSQSAIMIPFQQRVVACALLMMTRRKASKEVFLGKLYEAYVDLCKQRGLKFESETEFVGLCDMLDASGIIAIKKSKEIRRTKVSICALQLHEFLFHFFHFFLTLTGDFETRGYLFRFYIHHFLTVHFKI